MPSQRGESDDEDAFLGSEGDLLYGKEEPRHAVSEIGEDARARDEDEREVAHALEAIEDSVAQEKFLNSEGRHPWIAYGGYGDTYGEGDRTTLGIRIPPFRRFHTFGFAPRLVRVLRKEKMTDDRYHWRNREADVQLQDDIKDILGRPDLEFETCIHVEVAVVESPPSAEQQDRLRSLGCVLKTDAMDCTVIEFKRRKHLGDKIIFVMDMVLYLHIVVLILAVIDAVHKTNLLKTANRI